MVNFYVPVSEFCTTWFFTAGFVSRHSPEVYAAKRSKFWAGADIIRRPRPKKYLRAMALTIPINSREAFYV
jgi:hypothetical protein